MALPISPMEAIEIVQKAVELFQKIKNYPNEIAEVGRRIQRLSVWLSWLQTLLDDKTRRSLALLLPEQAQWLRTIMRDIRVDAGDVYEILNIWSSAGKVMKLLFPIGRNPRKLDDLIASMEWRRQDLSDALQLMGLFGQQHQLQNSIPHSGPGTTLATSAAASASRSDYGIIFVDADNQGRSKVAEGYTKLLREWTTRTGGACKIKFAHSAGMRLRNRSDCIDILQTLNPPIPISDGGKGPYKTAMASLFDNQLFNYPYKQGVKDSITSSRSRGLTKNLFKTYDYVLVFVRREHENLLLLRKALITAYGEAIAPPGKGRIIHLGAYLNEGKSPVEIAGVAAHKDGSSNRPEWNKATSQTKLAMKAFLKNELDWQQPPKGASGQS